MILKGKYVIFVEPSGLEYPVLIPNLFVKHDEIGGGKYTDKPVAAGFFTVKSIAAGCMGETDLLICASGKSVSLNLSSRPEIDAKIIRDMFDERNNL